MKKFNFKSILALALTVMMVVSLIPMAVFAEEVTTTKKYTFADYAQGEQYAMDEAHVLDDVITVTTSDAHFRSELRLYDSEGENGHNSIAIISSTNVINTIVLNAGNNAATLNVYGSTDGSNWTLVEGVSVVKEYADYTVTMPEGANYTYLKLDVEGLKQLRVTYMTITYVGGDGSAPEAPETSDQPVATPTTPEEIVNAAYALEAGASLEGTYTLTGVITAINTPYSEQYSNITVTIQVGDMADKPIQCFRMKGEGADTIKSGDTITVTGKLKNYSGTIEFDTGCSLDKVVPSAGEVVIYDNPKDIVNAAYELEVGKTLSDSHVYTLTGVISSVDTEYSEQYKNVTVTIVVEGMTDKPIQCFRLKGEGADVIKAGDTVTVSGTIINYNGKIEFNSGCVIDSYTAATAPETSPETGDEMIVLISAMLLAGVALLCVVSRKRRFN